MAELMAEKRQEKGAMAEKQRSKDRLRGGRRRGAKLTHSEVALQGLS